jgi:hypothetical protein
MNYISGNTSKKFKENRLLDMPFRARPSKYRYSKTSKFMANTCTQIHIQAVFAVQSRDCIIRSVWKCFLKMDQRNEILLKNAFHGRKDRVLFLTANPKYQMLSSILEIRTSIIERRLSLKNTKIYWRNLKLIMMSGSCLNLLITTCWTVLFEILIYLEKYFHA